MEKALLFAGVIIVRPRLLGLLLGGLEIRAKADSVLRSSGRGSAVSWATAELEEGIRFPPSAPAVFTARFFKFLGFLPGVEVLCNLKY